MTLAQANLQQAAAELRGAEANYKRSRELLAKKYISDAQHEANLARLDKARAALESQKAALASARANQLTGLTRAERRGTAARPGRGLAGLAAASLMQFASFSTTNFQTFADLAFRFTLTPSIVAKTIAFALAMALIGGFLAAVRAARLEIVDALRAS